MTPEEVVRTVLTAFEDSLELAAGVLWSLSAPKFRRGVHGEEHLARVLDNELFRPLARHSTYRLLPAERIEQAARQTVEVDSDQGERVHYLISLVLSGAGNQARWLITGIERQW